MVVTAQAFGNRRDYGRRKSIILYIMRLSHSQIFLFLYIPSSNSWLQSPSPAAITRPTIPRPATSTLPAAAVGVFGAPVLVFVAVLAADPEPEALGAVVRAAEVVVELPVDAAARATQNSFESLSASKPTAMSATYPLQVTSPNSAKTGSVPVISCAVHASLRQDWIEVWILAKFVH